MNLGSIGNRLPAEWQPAELVDICNPKQWKTIPTKALKDDGFIVYGANGPIGFYDEYTHEHPTIMITCRGATCGNLHTSVPKSYINGNAMALDDLQHSHVNLKFLFFALKARTLNDAISGSAQPQITRQGLSGKHVPLAPLAEQQEIARQLDSLLAQVNNLKTRLDALPALLKRFRQSVLAAGVSGKLTENWRTQNDNLPPQCLTEINRAWQSAYAAERKKFKTPTRAINSPKPEYLPKSWISTQLGSVFDIHVGATPSRKIESYWKGNINWVSSSEVAFCRIRKTKEAISREGLSNSSTRMHPPGTVMLAMIGQGKTRGQPAILDITACHNQNTAALRVLSDYCVSEYLYYYLYQRYEETRRAGSGTNQQAMNKSSVQLLPFHLPPKREQEEIVRRVEELFAFADQIEKQVKAAQSRVDKLTQSILAKAFRGELTADWRAQNPELISGENSAEALLARIKAEREKLGKGRGKRKRTARA